MLVWEKNSMTECCFSRITKVSLNDKLVHSVCFHPSVEGKELDSDSFVVFFIMSYNYTAHNNK